MAPMSSLLNCAFSRDAPQSPKNMTADTLFDAPLPVCIHPPTAIPQQNLPKTSLSATLTHSPAESTLSLTLSDLTTRLLLLHHVQSADTFPSARSPKSLTVDFSAYPALVAKYFQHTLSNPAFVPFLQLHPSPDASTPQPVLRIIEFEHGYNTTRIELPLTHASHQQLVSELAHRARTADQLAVKLSQLREQRDELHQQRDQLKRDLELREARIATADHDARRVEQLTDIVDDLRRRLAEAQSARDDADTACLVAQQEAAQRTSEVAADKARLAELESLRADAERKLEQSGENVEAVVKERDAAVAEIRKGNRIITSLQEKARAQQTDVRMAQAEAKSLKAKGKVKAALIAKLEERVGTLERESRRARDRAAMLEVEKEGLNGRLNSALGKLEENRAALESDQQVISYLNRELNDRLMSEISPSGSGRGRGRSPEGGRVRDNVSVGTGAG